MLEPSPEIKNIAVKEEELLELVESPAPSWAEQYMTRAERFGLKANLVLASVGGIATLGAMYNVQTYRATPELMDTLHQTHPNADLAMRLFLAATAALTSVATILCCTNAYECYIPGMNRHDEEIKAQIALELEQSQGI